MISHDREFPSIVTLGETMMVLASEGIGPLRHAGTLAMGVAGAESNVAIGVARLGVPSRWIGRLGDDEPGRMIAGALRAEGVATTAIIDQGAATGLMLKEQRTADVTGVSYYRAGSAGSRLDPSDLDPAVIEAAGVLHISGITPALSASCAATVTAAVDIAKVAGVTVSFDVNYRSRLWSAEAAAAALVPIARRADIIFAGEEEAELLVPGAADPLSALAGLGASEVLFKLGGAGATGLIDGELLTAPLYRVHAIDAVGAGDAFAAGYLAARARGLSAAERLDVAATTGAFAVTVRGDWTGAPTWDELHLVRGGDAVRR